MGSRTRGAGGSWLAVSPRTLLMRVTRGRTQKMDEVEAVLWRAIWRANLAGLKGRRGRGNGRLAQRKSLAALIDRVEARLQLLRRGRAASPAHSTPAAADAEAAEVPLQGCGGAAAEGRQAAPSQEAQRDVPAAHVTDVQLLLKVSCSRRRGLNPARALAQLHVWVSSCFACPRGS